MTESEALRLVAALNAAFPSEALEVPSVKIYVDALTELSSHSAVERAIRGLVDDQDRFPSIAKIRETYKAYRRQELHEFSRTHGLPEPERAPPPPEWFALGERLGVAPSSIAAGAAEGTRE